jgi:hypothetical protein
MDASLIQHIKCATLDCGAERPVNVEAKSRRVASIVATIYLALIVSAPLIVRYSPVPDDHVVAAVAERIDHPRCATPSESALPCTHLLPAAQPAGPVVADL